MRARPRLILPLAVLLLAAACGDDDVPAPSTTTAAPTTTTSATTATSAATTTSTAATTTVPLTATSPPAGNGRFIIQQVVFGDSAHITLINVGSGTGDIAGHWLCQRPSYFQLPSVDLAPGEFVVVTSGGSTDPEVVGAKATIDGSFGRINVASGEVGLYSAADFGNSEEIVDYVEWGSGGHGRSSVAVGAGIWEEGAFVEIPSEALAITVVQVPSDSPDDWAADIGG